MFRGNQPSRVDEKGRLKLPAAFKATVDETYGPKFFITSMDGERAEIYPMQEWEKIEAQVAKLSGSQKTRFLYSVNLYGHVVEMDNQGRLLLPQKLRDQAKLEGDMEVLGMQNHLTVVPEAVLLKDLAEKPLTQADMDEMKIEGL